MVDQWALRNRPDYLVGRVRSLLSGLGQGRAAVLAGQTSVQVAHGLPATPQNISVTPIGQPVNVGWSITAANGSTFTVALAAAQAQDWHFSWFGYAPNGG